MARRSSSAAPGLTRKQLSRAKREARVQRIIVISTVVVAVLVVALLAYGLIYNQIVKPSIVVATVNGETISVKDFEDRVKFEYFLYSRNQFNFVPFNALEILDQMTEEKVIEQRAAELGIEITEEELLKETQLLVGYDEGEPEPTDTPFPTPVTPEGSPTATPTFVITLTPTATLTLEPGVTPTETAEPTETLEPDVTPSATPEPTATETTTPFPTPTPMTEDDFNTVFDGFLEEGALATDLSSERMRELWYDYLKGNLLRQRLLEALEYEIDETQTVAHAAHILVATEEEALDVLARLEDGEEFPELAAELSADPATAYKGGELGWVRQEGGFLSEPLEEAIFSIEVGELGEPIEDEQGWHIVMVYDRQDVETTFSERETRRQEQFQEQVDSWVADADIDIDEEYPKYVPELPEQQQPQLPFQ